MNTETVRRLVELSEKATPGPYGFQDGTYPHDGYFVITAKDMNARSPIATVNQLGDKDAAKRDAEYIAFLLQHGPSLAQGYLDAVERIGMLWCEAVQYDQENDCCDCRLCGSSWDAPDKEFHNHRCPFHGEAKPQTEIVRLTASIASLEQEVARLRANQRTPGAIETCPQCGHWNEGGIVCVHDDCPLRAAQQTAST